MTTFLNKPQAEGVEVQAELITDHDPKPKMKFIEHVVYPLTALIIDTSSQGTDEWKQARAGHATGSCFQDIIAMSKPDKSGKSRPLKARETYMWQLVTERINGVPVDSPTSQAMAWGSDVEPFARQAYEAETGNVVEECGFIKRPDLPWVGVSVDGLVDADGTIEMKCPKDSVVHMQTWANGVPEEHYAQIQGGLWVTGRMWCDFISYDPRAAEPARLYVKRVHRDPAFIDNLAEQVKTFLADVDRMTDAVRGAIGGW